MNPTRLISGHDKDLGGGFKVLRLLPALGQRSVGPFIFMDHFGPAISHGDPAHDVRPHPHIGLSTVSYLFEGGLLHHDSTGARQEIRPGDINWMTAGRGIVHSERAPEHLRGRPYALHGLQLWCALPLHEEDCAPAFQHVAADELPTIQRDGVRVKLLVGTLDGLQSPVRTATTTLYLHLTLAPGARLDLSAWAAELPEELAVYAPNQDLLLNDEPLPARRLAVLPAHSAGAASTASTPTASPPLAPTSVPAPFPTPVPTPAESPTGVVDPSSAWNFELVASPLTSEPTDVIVLGGARLDAPRHLWWNFVSSRQERIDEAARDWAEGHFPPVAGEADFIPLPARR
jgi:redox-sensitive bicupin YhaK (pirin superfamily)